MVRSEPNSKESTKATGRSKEEDKNRRNVPSKPGTSVNSLTLQVRKRGLLDFSRIFQLRYKSD